MGITDVRGTTTPVVCSLGNSAIYTAVPNLREDHAAHASGTFFSL